MIAETVVLVGAGVVANGWDPVISALRRTYFPDMRSPEAANFAMARFVYAARLTRPGGALEKLRQETVAHLDKIRDAIACDLREAEEKGQLVTRPEFLTVVKREAVDVSKNVIFATTNWDGAVEKAVRHMAPTAVVHHVHGRSADSRKLYLPTEVVEEPYRTEEEAHALAGLRTALARAIGSSERLVFYGLGLSPLDAELGQVLASGVVNSSVREAIVVDPNYPDVAERLATLPRFGGADLPVRCALPWELSRTWTFNPDELSVEKHRLAGSSA